MEMTSKTRTTALAIAAFAILSGTFCFFIFKNSAEGLNRDIRILSEKIRQDREILARKNAIESEWASKKDFLQTGMEVEAAANAWANELLSIAQSQSLVLEKLEPAGIKSIGGRKKAVLFASFHGDIRVFSGFIYRLLEKDPLSGIESFGIRREEDSQLFSFELMLSKDAR